MDDIWCLIWSGQDTWSVLKTTAGSPTLLKRSAACRSICSIRWQIRAAVMGIVLPYTISSWSYLAVCLTAPWKWKCSQHCYGCSIWRRACGMWPIQRSHWQLESLGTRALWLTISWLWLEAFRFTDEFLCVACWVVVECFLRRSHASQSYQEVAGFV